VTGNSGDAIHKNSESWSISEELVFVVGPERSGTSLMFQQISNHPDFCNFKEATVETFCFIKPWLLLEQSSRKNYEMRLYLKGGGLQAMQGDIQPIIKVNNALSEMGISKSYVNERRRKEIWSRRCYKELLRMFFYRSSLALGGKRVVEKTPAHIRCLDEIFDTFPSAKVIVCVRDIAEIIASHRKRFNKEVELGKAEDDSSLEWLNHTTKEYLKYFKNIEKLISAAKHKWPDQIKIVPYGDLTADPDNILGDIYDFIGIEAGACNKKTRLEQAWDPLLNKKPQVNLIDIDNYISSNDLVTVNNFKSKLQYYWR
jgi:hypothetical protein